MFLNEGHVSKKGKLICIGPKEPRTTQLRQFASVPAGVWRLASSDNDVARSLIALPGKLLSDLVG